MKKLLPLSIMLFLVSIAFNSLSQADTTHTTKQEIITLDLTGAGISATMQVPPGTTAQNIGGAVISNEKDFVIRAEIVTQSFSLDTLRDKAQGNDVEKFKRYIVNTGDAILYEVFIHGDRIEYLLHALVNVGGKYYHFYNDRGIGRYNENSAMAMYNAVKTIKAK